MKKMNEEDYTVSTGITKKIVGKPINKNRIEGWYWCRDGESWNPHYYDPEEGFVECADYGLYWQDSDFDEIDEKIAEPPKLSELQISNIYKGMNNLIKSKNDPGKDKSILIMQGEDILYQMLIALGHKELTLMHNSLY